MYPVTRDLHTCLESAIPHNLKSSFSIPDAVLQVRLRRESRNWSAREGERQYSVRCPGGNGYDPGFGRWSCRVEHCFALLLPGNGVVCGWRCGACAEHHDTGKPFLYGSQLLNGLQSHACAINLHAWSFEPCHSPVEAVLPVERRCGVEDYEAERAVDRIVAGFVEEVRLH